MTLAEARKIIRQAYSKIELEKQKRINQEVYAVKIFWWYVLGLLFGGIFGLLLVYLLRDQLQ